MAVVYYLIFKRKQHFCLVLIDIFSNILGKSSDFPDDASGWKPLFAFWFLCAFVISSSYSAVLLSFLTLPPPIKILKNFRELSAAVFKGTHQAYSSNGSLTVPFMFHSDEKHLKIIGRAMMDNNWYYDLKSVYKGLTLKPGIVMIMSRTLLNVLYGGNFASTIYISPDLLFVVPMGIAINKKFCCTARVNKIISRMVGGGLGEKILKDESLKFWLEVSSKVFMNEEKNPLHFLSKIYQVLF
ncbi:lig_chan-Glu_bd domain-containing protein [Caerostris extrusa]|uniref:Lig_chan-Glu_bd domain-containing protein n=1 Tax=Caerostris extrusa TaxID=172846 RepID=A0AAV4Y5V1_CAEEX|nr:lig_chan-Glu_bd domain-containing protein [Caerostris extrusa]